MTKHFNSATLIIEEQIKQENKMTNNKDLKYWLDFREVLKDTLINHREMYTPEQINQFEEHYATVRKEIDKLTKEK